jgi:hypothetical protein
MITFMQSMDVSRSHSPTFSFQIDVNIASRSHSPSFSFQIDVNIASRSHSPSFSFQIDVNIDDFFSNKISVARSKAVYSIKRLREPIDKSR